MLFRSILRGGAASAEEKDGMRLGDRLSDPAWKRSFESVLAERAAAERMAAETVETVCRLLYDHAAGPDPRAAALRAAEIAGNLDADIRRGVPPGAAAAAYRHLIRNAAEFQAVRRRLLDKGLYAPAPDVADRIRRPDTPGEPAAPRRKSPDVPKD